MTVWNKETLAESVNQRIDRNELKGEYVLPVDISDIALTAFQEWWDVVEAYPVQQKEAFKKLHQQIVGGH